MLMLCYPKCTTCKKAAAWLSQHGIEVPVRDIKTENPTEDELRLWHKLSGAPLKRFFNTSGMRYRELGLGTALAGMSEEEQIKLLASDGMLVKRPLLIKDDTVLIGFKEKEWETALGK